MKKLFFLIFIFQLSYTIAQNDAFVNDTYSRNGLVYLDNKPFTGTLYSEDEIDVPNKCFCTFKASYLNGKLHGKKEEWYNNGKKKIIQKYTNGKRNGVQKVFNSNGILIISTEFLMGNPILEEKWDTDKSKTTTSYTDDIIKITHHTSTGAILDTQYHSKSNKTKEGVWVKYNKEGKIINETVFEDGKLLRTGNFFNGLKTGIWKFYSLDGNQKTIKEYKNDKEISSKTTDFSKSIGKHYKAISNKLLLYFDKTTNTSKYYLLKKTNEFLEPLQLKIKNKLESLIYNRLNSILNTKSIQDNELNGIIEISNIRVSYKETIHKRTRIENNQKIPYEELGYDAFISYRLSLTSLDYSTLFDRTYKVNKSDKLLNSIFNSALGAYSTSKSDAFNSAFKHIQINQFLSSLFPLKGKMQRVISQNKNSISKVEINLGYSKNVKKKMVFYVLDGESKLKAKLQVIEVKSSTAICKVVSNKKWLKQYNQNKTTLIVQEAK